MSVLVPRFWPDSCSPASLSSPLPKYCSVNCLPDGTLCKKVRSLMSLWMEYKFGINGRKPAESFTLAERNAKSVKQRYWRRSLVWKTIDRLVRGGLSAEIAIARIRGVYGERTCVTKIMELMVRDKRRYPAQVHPRLL